MTILFGGGEMGAFTPSDSNVMEYTSGAPYDTSFARCALRAHGNTAYGESPAWSGVADIWVHFDIVHGGMGATAQPSLVLVDGSGVERFRVASSSASSPAALHLQYNIGAGWVDFGTPIAVALSDTRQTVDVHIVMNSASGSGSLYLSGTPRIEGTGVNLSTVTSVTKLRCYGSTPVITNTQLFSQVVAATVSTVGWRETTVPPTGAGFSTAFIGGFSEVDEIVYSDADFINSDTAAQVELFTHSTTIPTGYTVRAVVVTARAKRGASGPQKLRLCVRSAGTTYDNGADLTLGTGYGSFAAVWETDPATSAAFTASSITNLQFGVKSIA